MHECLDTHVQVFYPWFWPFRESLVTWKCGWDTLRNWQFKCGLEPDSEQVSLSGSVKVSEWHVLLNITVICLNWTGYLRTEVYQHEMAKMGLCWYSQAGFCVRSWKKLVLDEEPIPFSLRDVSVLPGLSTDLSWPSPIPETKKNGVVGVLLNSSRKDFPGGPVLRLCGSQCRGPRVRALVRELNSTCCN